MSEKILKDSPEVFMYQEPIGKRTYLAVLVGALALLVSGIYLIVNLAAGTTGLHTEIAFGVVLVSLACIFILPVMGAKRMMEIKSEFSQWAVVNYGLTPLEFMTVNIADAKSDPTRFEKETRVSVQKFLNSDSETVTATVTEDRSSEDIVHGEYAKVTITNIQLHPAAESDVAVSDEISQ